MGRWDFRLILLANSVALIPSVLSDKGVSQINGRQNGETIHNSTPVAFNSGF